MRLPGTRLLAIARLCIDPATISRVLEPLVADWQREWLANHSSLDRLRVRLRELGAFCRAAAYCIVVDEMPNDVRRRTWTALAVFVALGTLVMGILYAWVPFEVPFEATPYLLPSTLALSIPFAVLPLAMQLATSRDRRDSRRHLVRFTIGIALLVFVLHNWITPHANQAFREHMSLRMAERADEVASYRPPSRGLHELTLPDLLVRSSGPSVVASRAKVREELHSRITLPLVPVALAMLGWSLASVTRSASKWRLAGWWIVAAISYGVWRDLGMAMERSWQVSRELAAWLPLTLWLLPALLLWCSQARSTRHSLKPL